jgi:hypothetical protein
MAGFVTFGKNLHPRLPLDAGFIWKTLIKQSYLAHLQSGAFLASDGYLETLQIDKPYASDCSTLLS